MLRPHYDFNNFPPATATSIIELYIFKARNPYRHLFTSSIYIGNDFQIHRIIDFSIDVAIRIRLRTYEGNKEKSSGRFPGNSFLGTCAICKCVCAILRWHLQVVRKCNTHTHPPPTGETKTEGKSSLIIGETAISLLSFPFALVETIFLRATFYLFFSYQYWR